MQKETSVKLLKLLLMNGLLIAIAIHNLLFYEKMLGVTDARVIISFGIIAILSVLNINLSWRYDYSFYKIHGYFFYIFMFIAAVYQYINNKNPWQGQTIANDDRVFTNLIIILWMVIVIFTYEILHILRRKRGIAPSKEKTVNPRAQLSDQYSVTQTVPKILFILLGIFITLFAMKFIGFSNLFSRSTRSISASSSSLRLVINRLTNFIPAFLLIFYLNDIQKSRRKNPSVKVVDILILAVLLLFNIAINFPTGIARYLLASIYMPVALLIVPKLLGKNFDLILLVGMFFIFPFVNFFRHNTFENLANFTFVGIELGRGDFDAYSMLASTTYYVADHGLTWGNQLLGCMLFFVPRTMWPNKPIGSGITIARAYQYNFDNVSCPLIGESFINFGIAGVILFAGIIAISMCVLDMRFWRTFPKDKPHSFEALYLVLVPMFFFILRGDLLSSGSYAFSAVFVWSLLRIIGQWNYNPGILSFFKRKSHQSLSSKDG